MVAKRFFYGCTGICLLALAYHLGARSATAQSVSQAVSIASVGGTNTGFEAMNASGDVFFSQDQAATWNGPASDSSASIAAAPRPGELLRLRQRIAGDARVRIRTAEGILVIPSPALTEAGIVSSEDGGPNAGTSGPPRAPLQWERIREVQLSRSAAPWTALAVGTLGAVVGYAYEPIDYGPIACGLLGVDPAACRSEPPSTGERIQHAALGLALGGAVGGLIGWPIKYWKTVYRAPGTAP